jgi:hypothetical protein
VTCFHFSKALLLFTWLYHSRGKNCIGIYAAAAPTPLVTPTRAPRWKFLSDEYRSYVILRTYWSLSNTLANFIFGTALERGWDRNIPLTKENGFYVRKYEWTFTVTRFIVRRRVVFSFLLVLLFLSKKAIIRQGRAVVGNLLYSCNSWLEQEEH